MDDARDGGWIEPVTDPATVTDLINLFDFSLVHWSELPKQFGTWIGMVFIVAFGSCLDIAAIELDMDKKLDFNQELNTVGWSNVVSGLLGGYTGSYIFSQTIFTYESAIVVAPVSVMSYVPRFFFAATLIFIANDLMVEWLVLARKQMSLREYAMSNAIAYFVLSGFLFFGSSVQILDRVQKAVYVRKPLVAVGGDDDSAYYYSDASVLLLTPDENRTPLIECLDGTPATSPDTVPAEHVVMDFTDVTAVVRSAFLILQKNNIVGEESFFRARAQRWDFARYKY
ncbi:SLC26A/SulP transporter domain [Phytophthora cactorum]|nr:SLC26A/SulP transporter domain [Phytophthora cactorum]